MGIGPQCRTDVREGLLVVAGLVHTPLWGGQDPGVKDFICCYHFPISTARWTHLVEGLGVHCSVAFLKHTALLQQHRAVGLCTHLWGQQVQLWVFCSLPIPTGLGG